jgi:hypothetical protein
MGEPAISDRSMAVTANSMEMQMARSPKTPDTTTKLELPAPTFNLAAVERIVNEAPAEQAQAMAAKPANGKAAQVDMQVIRSFKRAGFGVVKPRIDTKTFNIWLAEGKRPLEGSKSVKVGRLRLFHRSQVRELTPAERAEGRAKDDAAVAANKAKILSIPEAQPQ